MIQCQFSKKIGGEDHAYQTFIIRQWVAISRLKIHEAKLKKNDSNI